MSARIVRPEPPHSVTCRDEYANRPYELGATNGKPWVKHANHQIDDIRRCRHGIVQICYWTHPHSPGHWDSVPHPLDYAWRDISKFWERRLYHQAVSALEEEEK